MTVSVANTQLTSTTFDFWRQRTNEMADAMTRLTVTVNSNTTTGNASVNGYFQGLVLVANTLQGGATVNASGSVMPAAANLTVTSGFIIANSTAFATGGSFTVGNSTVNTALTNSSISTGSLTLSGAMTATGNVTAANGSFSGFITVTGNVTSNATLVGNALRLANSTNSIAVAIPTTTQANGSFFLCGNGSWTQISIPAGVSPGGANTNIQFNDGGSSFGGSSGFTFDKTTNNAVIANTLTVSQFSAATSNVFIAANGNIGWGTVTPAYDIESVNNLNSLVVSKHTINTNTGASAAAAVLINAGAGTGNLMLSSNGTSGLVYTSDATTLALGSNNAQRMYIVANGNIGVGTNAPQYTIDVSGSINVSGTLSGPTATVTNLNANVVSANSFAGSGVSTAAQYWANTAGKVLTSDVAWTAAFAQPVTASASVTIDLSQGLNFAWVQNQNFTLNNPTNPKNGQSGFIVIQQDATGSRTMTLGTAWKFPNGGAKALSTAANSIDILFYTVYTSSFIACTLNKGYA